jgi:hypothetical protein
VTVACYYSHLIGIVDCKVGVYEDEDIGYGFGEGESWSKECPGMRVGVKDDDEKGGRGTYIVL